MNYHDVLEEDETQAPEETETEEETTTEASEEAKEDETEAAAKVQEETLKTAPASKGSEWKDITDTKRPEATEDVTHDKGTSDDKLHIQDKNWDIFYDAEKDVYKITFNIGSDAEASTQVVDLTKALELLGQYAESGKQELQDAIDAIEKPVKGDAGKAPEMGEIDVEQPKEPEKPVAPDAPEKLSFGSERPARRAEKTAFLARLTVCVMKEETKWKEKNWVHGWDLFFCLRDAQLELEMCGDFHISRAYTAEACSYCFICFS